MPQRDQKPHEPKGRKVGRFDMFDVVASGGFATIHLGRTPPKGGKSELVAIKRLHPQFVQDDEIKKMFLQEARLAAQVNHPNVVPTLEMLDEAGELFLVMEFVEGVSLAHLIEALRQKKQRIPLDIVLRVFTGTLRGLHAAHTAKDEHGHALGLIHRDVSPDNILVGVDGEARLIDFGVARAIGRYQVKHEGELKGKLHYLAPEQVMGGEPTSQSDVFSAAVVLWQCLTGEPLFVGATMAELAPKIMGQAIDEPSVLVPGVPAKVDRVVMRGLERDAALRWGSAAEMADALEDASTLASAGRVGKWVQRTAEERIARSADKASAVELTPPRQATGEEGKKSVTQASTGENSYQAVTMQVVSMPSARKRKSAKGAKAPDKTHKEKRVEVAPGADAPPPVSQRLQADAPPISTSGSHPGVGAPPSSPVPSSSPGLAPQVATSPVAASPSQPGLAASAVGEISSPDVHVTPPAAPGSAPDRRALSSDVEAPLAEVDDEPTEDVTSDAATQRHAPAAPAVLDEATPAPEAERLDGPDGQPASRGGRSKLPLVLGAAAAVAAVIGGVSLMGSEPPAPGPDRDPAAALPADSTELEATAATESETAPTDDEQQSSEPAEAPSAEPVEEPDDPPDRVAPVARAPERPAPAAPAEPTTDEPKTAAAPPPPPPPAAAPPAPPAQAQAQAVRRRGSLRPQVAAPPEVPGRGFRQASRSELRFSDVAAVMRSTNATALGVLALALVAGCGSTNGQTPPGTGPLPPWLAQPLAQPSASAAPSSSVEPMVATAADPAAVFDPTSIVAVLDEPRLAEVKQAVARGAYRRAADALERLLRDRPPEPEQEPAWTFQLALLRKRSGEPLAAVRAFDRASAVDWPLSSYARWMAADLLAQVGEPAEAEARLRPVPSGLAVDDQVALVRAEALAGSGKVDEAVAVWLPYLERTPRPGGWQTVALRCTRALLNHPSVEHAKQAVEVSRMVIYESPAGRGVGEARELEQRALSTIPSTERSPLIHPEAAELADRANALADARQGREAMAAADGAIKLLTEDAPADLACEAYLGRGKGLAALRRYNEASDVFQTAIERCAGRPRQVYALFLGGRYALRGGLPAEARRRYALLEERFPEHSFADDARLHGATAALELGDVAAFVQMLSRMADDYPDGDMVDDGLFALARVSMERGDWAACVAPLERAIKRQQRGRPYYAEGRPQYFLGRAKLELGLTEQGVAQLSGVLREFPLSYYAGLAYARLARQHRSQADRVLTEAALAEPRGNFVIHDTPALHTPAFLRAVELVRQGEGELARQELDQLGVRDKTAEPSVLWASAFLLARIEAPSESHGVLRAASGAWSTHFPAGVWRSVWEVAFPRPFHELVREHAKRSSIAEHLIYAVMREESAFRPRAVSWAGAYGLMQLIQPTGRSMAKQLGLPSSPAALKRPEVNIPLGARYLGILTRRFDYNPLLAIPGYNAGPGAPARWVRQRPEADFDLFVERIPYRETRRYTKRVLASLIAYTVLYGDGLRDPFIRLPLKVKPSSASDEG